MNEMTDRYNDWMKADKVILNDYTFEVNQIRDFIKQGYAQWQYATLDWSEEKNDWLFTGHVSTDQYGTASYVSGLPMSAIQELLTPIERAEFAREWKAYITTLRSRFNDQLSGWDQFASLINYTGD